MTKIFKGSSGRLKAVKGGLPFFDTMLLPVKVLGCMVKVLTFGRKYSVTLFEKNRHLTEYFAEYFRSKVSTFGEVFQYYSNTNGKVKGVSGQLRAFKPIYFWKTPLLYYTEYFDYYLTR